MRASELITQLQEIMEDHHCDPKIEVQTGVVHHGFVSDKVDCRHVDIETESAWFAKLITRHTEPVIVIRNYLMVRDGYKEKY